MLKCPVCPRTDVPDEAQQCPNCGTDLAPVRRVRDLCAAYFNEALRLADAGATDPSMTRAAAALALDDQFLPARKLLGKLLLAKGRLDEAMGQWEQAAALCPEDEEVQLLMRAARKLRFRRVVKRAGTIAVAMLAAGAVLLGVPYAHYRITSRRADALLLPLVELQEYRRAHSRPDTDYAALMEKMAEIEKAREGISRALARYRETHSRPDSDYAFLRGELAKTKGASQELSLAFSQYRETRSRTDEEYEDLLKAQAAEARATSEYIRQALEDIRAEVRSTHDATRWRYRRVVELAVDMHEALRPAEADELIADMEECRQEIDRLVAVRHEHQSRGLVGLDAIGHFSAGRKLNRARKRLESLEDQYAKHIGPWEKRMQALQAALTELGERLVDERGAANARAKEWKNP